ncbi:hypothetical protein SMD11_6326 [Streptomyces albireticuli]|uniref:PNPLA domain-containing protein n=1 Tax=Streptomyces albireticuli TaxID=1940 RepID=A0A1Z2LC94_9ACTN|nr:DUF3376 domain-containing protein [Streptomyces albireticuli]ARZ71902.1 hypothetical protein SMD11_6326 [Streptomyces albireticuli]
MDQVPKELRIAVAMRGGVSLAVWMGGGCREIAALRGAAQDRARGAAAPGAEGYGALLDLCRYDDVTVDVLAGTSAGGLNGALLACHLAYGMEFGDNMRRLWLRLGDLESLTRSPGTPRLPGLPEPPDSPPDLPRVPDSLLRGDEVFYERLADSLLTEIGKQPPDRPGGGPVRLILTATRVTPRQDWVRPTIGQPLEVGRTRAFFRFRHRPGTAFLTDFGSPSGPWPPEDAVRRLAYAARTSSSFPGAFEPGQPFVGAPGSTVPPHDPDVVDMSSVSSEAGHGEAPDGRLELVDGGLLDNIPVAWAVRAIAGMPAKAPVDRWLLYLQPEPPMLPDAVAHPVQQRRMTRLLRLARRASAIKAGSESLWEDAVDLRAAQSAAEQRQAPVAALPATGWAREALRPGRLARHRTLTGRAEADRFARLLEDPAEVTGPDPLPLPPGPGPLDGGGSPFCLQRLRQAADGLALPAEPGSLADVRAYGISPLPLARAVRLLFDGIQAAEETGQTVSPAARERLYACRLAVATLVAVRDRLVLRRFRECGEEPVRRIREATVWLGAVMAEAGTPGPEDVAAWQEWPGRLAAAVAVANPATADLDADWPEDLYGPVWRRLAALGREIGADVRRPVPGFGGLQGAGPDGVLDALLAAEVLIGPLRPDPLGEPTRIRFHTVSAANSSWATRQAFPAAAEDLVDAKLGGNELRNFASFLSVRWRLNDWTWGRLDTAASLVDVVATDERLAKLYTGPDDPALAGLLDAPVAAAPTGSPWDPVRAAVTERIQRQILDEELPLLESLQEEGRDEPLGAEPDTPVPPPPPDDRPLDERLVPLVEVGAEPVGELVRRPAPRRAALRLGLVAWRALQPSGDRPRTYVARGLMELFRPLVCLPLVLSLVAPSAALAAAVCAWFAVMAGTGVWFSYPAHLAVLVGVSLAATGLCLHHAAKGRRALLPGFLVPLGAGLVAAYGWLDHQRAELGPASVFLVTALGYGGAVALALVAGVGVRRVSVVTPVLAGVGAGAVQAAAHPLPAWAAFAVLYGVLAAGALALTFFFPQDDPDARAPDLHDLVEAPDDRRRPVSEPV